MSSFTGLGQGKFQPNMPTVERRASQKIARESTAGGDYLNPALPGVSCGLTARMERRRSLRVAGMDLRLLNLGRMMGLRGRSDGKKRRIGHGFNKTSTKARI